MTEERRLVTILFADVEGSTALGESLDPEDLRALLSRYYAIASEVIGDYGGTVEKFIGDAVMAVFGLPVAHGDDAERHWRRPYPDMAWEPKAAFRELATHDGG